MYDRKRKLRHVKNKYKNVYNKVQFGGNNYLYAPIKTYSEIKEEAPYSFFEL